MIIFGRDRLPKFLPEFVPSQGNSVLLKPTLWGIIH
jgi:hypothetical protein